MILQPGSMQNFSKGVYSLGVAAASAQQAENKICRQNTPENKSLLFYLCHLDRQTVNQLYMQRKHAQLLIYAAQAQATS